MPVIRSKQSVYNRCVLAANQFLSASTRWSEKTLENAAVATRDIEPGEEINISCIRDPEIFLSQSIVN